MTAVQTARSDGRHLRRERSRAAIVDALLELIRETASVPATAEVAQRAGVTQRTIFNHFEDVPALLASAVRAQVGHVRELLPPVPPHRPVQARVGIWVAALAPHMDEISAVRWVVVTHPNRAAELNDGLRVARDAFRQRLADLAAAELGRRAEPDRAELLDALELAVDPMTWRLSRTVHGRSIDEAAAIVTTTMVALMRRA